jgi:hypothetical protein
MRMAVCPLSRNHNEFITTAHVVQDWKVDGLGNFIDVVDDCLQVTHEPEDDNCWECATCGAEAIFEDCKDRVEDKDSDLLNAAKCALADLEGIMPEFEPSGDREHSAWRTINELRYAIKKCEG